MGVKEIFEIVQGRRTLESLKPNKTTAPPAPLTLEQEIIRDWKASAEIRKEFHSLACYSAFRRAESKGLVKIVKGGAITAIKP